MKRKELWKLLDDNKELIIDRYLSGESSFQIANDFKIGYNNVLRLLKKNNVPIRSVRNAQTLTKQKDLVKEDIQNLYDEGKTCKQIGDIFNCSDNTIRKFMERNEIQRRNKSEAASLSMNHWANLDNSESVRLSISEQGKKHTDDEVADLLEYEEYVIVEEGEFRTSKSLLRCPQGHLWETKIHKYIQGNRCPYCHNRCEGDTYICLLELLEIDIKRNKYLCDYTYETNIHKAYVDFQFVLDGKKYVIEYNGKQHYEPVPFGGISNEEALDNFKRQIVRDESVDKYCKENDISIVWIDGRSNSNKTKIMKLLKEKINVN